MPSIFSNFFLLFIVFALFASVMGKGCRFEECSINYKTAMEESGSVEIERDPVAYCPILQSFLKCMRSTTKPCRGELQFHGTLFAFNKLEKEMCQQDGGPHGNRNKTRSSLMPPQPTSPPPSCKYFGSFRFRHCGVFGDPHLKTFEGMYQTCKVHGTWTMIDNPYMSVHVTNQPVASGSLATAPTKISIVVKGRSTPCTLEKRYEADSEFPLPRTFLDGTDRSGPDRTVVLSTQPAAEDGREYVEITMKYIASKLIVRKIGRYLAFSAKIPEDVIQTSKSYNEDKIELCTVGCPAAEQLGGIIGRSSPPGVTYLMDRDEALKRCKETENLSEDIANNLTDSYLDWCVFDLMTAGSNDVYDFVAAAHSAQGDAIKLDPSSLNNRTTLLLDLFNPNVKILSSDSSSSAGSSFRFSSYFVKLPYSFSVVFSFLPLYLCRIFC